MNDCSAQVSETLRRHVYLYVCVCVRGGGVVRSVNVGLVCACTFSERVCEYRSAPPDVPVGVGVDRVPLKVLLHRFVHNFRSQ